MEPSPTPLLRKPSPLAGAEKRARVPSVSFSDQCVELTPNLKRYAIALTKNRDTAEDLVQDTLVRALTKQHLWKSGTDLRAWLFTVMFNQRNSNLRKYRFEREHFKPDADVTLSPAPSRADIGVIIRDAVKLISALPKPQRDVLLLAGVEGLDYAAISARSGVLKNTVRSSLSRARAKLKAAADENYGSARLSYEHIERGIARSFNQYTAYINGKTHYYATLQEARDARAAI